MKALLFLLLPLFVYAQTPYPDTLFMKYKRSFPCLFTGMDESRVEFIYANNYPEKTVIEGVDKIILGEYGVVYKSGTGFLMNLDSLEIFMAKRSSLVEERMKAREIEKITASEKKREKVAIPEEKSENTISESYSENNWSFGVQYIPYYSGKIYSFYRQSDYPMQIISTINNETNMEGQFSFRLSAKFRLTFDVGYTAAFTENRDETHIRYQNPLMSDNDYGSSDSKDLKLFLLNIGIKYYFKDFLNEKVTVYALAGIGKQFAFSESKNETLFQQPQPGIISENNRDEYLEDLNSPWHLNFGFGAEYMFNESLSLFSTIRFYYSTLSAKYDSRTVNNYRTESLSNEISKSDFITRVGVGLNFYF